MKRTEFRRIMRRMTDEILVGVQNASQAELNWLYRQLQYKIRRINQNRPRTGLAKGELCKFTINQADLWEMFRHRMQDSLIRELLSGAIALAALYNEYYAFEQPVEIDSDEFARALEPEIGMRVTRVSNSIRRQVGHLVVGWYNTPGMTMNALVGQLQPTFGRSRAALIAQNEVTSLNSGVNETIARRAGIGEWWWSTRRDQIVCKKPLKGPDGRIYRGCRELHGKVFQVGMPMPPNGSHIGCRCDAVLVVPAPKKESVTGVTTSNIAAGLVQKADWEEEKHPRSKNGEFAPKGQGEAHGPADKPKTAKPSINYAPNPAIDDLPEVKEFRKKHYVEAVNKIYRFADQNGINEPQKFADAMTRFRTTMLMDDDPIAAYRDYLKDTHSIVAGKLNTEQQANLVRLENAIRVADWRFIKNLKLPEKPVKVKEAGDAKPKEKPVKVVNAISGVEVAKRVLAIADNKEDNKNWTELSKKFAAADKALHENPSDENLHNYRMAIVALNKAKQEMHERRKQEIDKLLKVENPGKIRRDIRVAGFTKKSVAYEADTVIDNIQELMDASVKIRGTVSVKNVHGRACFIPPLNQIAVDEMRYGDRMQNAISHEMGHFIEYNNHGAALAAREFLTRRTQGEEAQPLNKLRACRACDDNEIGKPDKFFNPYVGKLYGDDATEVISMGLDEYMRDPSEFAKKDAEHFGLIYDILHGRYE